MENTRIEQENQSHVRVRTRAMEKLLTMNTGRLPRRCAPRNDVIKMAITQQAKSLMLSNFCHCEQIRNPHSCPQILPRLLFNIPSNPPFTHSTPVKFPFPAMSF